MQFLSTNKFKSFWLLKVQNIDNKGKKYVNISELSSGETYALLDSVESDNENDIENFMNDSDPEFVIEESIVARSNIVVGYQKQPVLVPKTSTHIGSVDSDNAVVGFIR